jgi:hypothetical protein
MRNGEFYGHARYYFMATYNNRDLKDFFANAFGMGIGYETGKFKGFQLGISGFFIYNLYSSDFTEVDARTGVGSRYEIGQFDMLNPTNKSDMDRLEDLYLKYTYKLYQVGQTTYSHALHQSTRWAYEAHIGRGCIV